MGALVFAIPMAVFGADHFTFAKGVAALVPPWMPAHLFWTYFVGVALIAAALSITLGIYSTVAAALLAWMIFSFDLLIHIPNLIASHGDRFRAALVLREISFSGGALALALTQAQKLSDSGKHALITLVRVSFAIAAVVFGAEHFFHPQFLPVIPLKLPMPAWFPLQTTIAYITGLVMIACGFALLFNWKARLAAAWLGIFVFAIVMAVYLPIMLEQLSDIGAGLNPFADTLAYCGAALLLAGALPETEEDRSAKLERGRKDHKKTKRLAISEAIES